MPIGRPPSGNLWLRKGDPPAGYAYFVAETRPASAINTSVIPLSNAKLTGSFALARGVVTTGLPNEPLTGGL